MPERSLPPKSRLKPSMTLDLATRRSTLRKNMSRFEQEHRAIAEVKGNAAKFIHNEQSGLLAIISDLRKRGESGWIYSTGPIETRSTNYRVIQAWVNALCTESVKLGEKHKELGLKIMLERRGKWKGLTKWNTWRIHVAWSFAQPSITNPK